MDAAPLIKRFCLPIRFWLMLLLAPFVTRTWVEIEILNARAEHILPNREKRDDGTTATWREDLGEIELVWRDIRRWGDVCAPEDLDGPEADTYARIVRKLTGDDSTPRTPAEDDLIRRLLAENRADLSKQSLKELTSRIEAGRPIRDDARYSLNSLVINAPGAMYWLDQYEGRAELTPEQRRQLLAALDGNPGRFSPDLLAEYRRLLSEPASTATRQSTQPPPLQKLLDWAPLTPKERARWQRDHDHAERRNRLLGFLSTWGVLQYLLAPLTFFLSLATLVKVKDRLRRAVAVLCLATSATGWGLMHARAYFSSLGW